MELTGIKGSLSISKLNFRNNESTPYKMMTIR